MYYKSTSHILHGVLTLITGGAWAIVWLVCGLRNSQHNKTLDRIKEGK